MFESEPCSWRLRCLDLARHRSSCPTGPIRPLYLVVDSVSASGCGYRETEIERTDFETIIADFLTGQFNDPIRVIAFNTLEHWSDDISEAVAAEIQTRCDIEGVSVPEHVRDFVDHHWGPVRQFVLKLANDAHNHSGGRGL